MVKTHPPQESCVSPEQAPLGTLLSLQAAHICHRSQIIGGYKLLTQLFCEKLEGELLTRLGGSTLPWLCSRRLSPGPRCGQSVLPFPSQLIKGRGKQCWGSCSPFQRGCRKW